MAKSDKMYKDSPAIEKDENGKPGIKKPTTADAEDMAVEGPANEGEAQPEMPIDVHQASERRSVVHRHIAEHLAQHHQHESEAASGGDKAEMFKRHTEDHKAMVGRHHEEMKAMLKKHSKDKEV